ncbi:MAG TPA: S1/P1 nuclease [Bacteroidota bacterium]|nr:S1/P1 nuclease [Bacteroidota bacterium]
MNHSIDGWRSSLRVVLFLAVSLLCSVTEAWPWGATGHHIINLKAPIHLPDSTGRLKADSLYYAAHASDADNRKVSGDTSFFSESLRHFIDIDYYPNFHSIPHSLDSMIALYGRSTVHNQGTNPWITVILLDTLTAQLRRNDYTDADQTLADLGHYIGDAHQPLHCTENYDGAMTGNSGIHSRYETTMINDFQTQIVITPASVQYISDPLDYIFGYIYQSNSYVDSIMAADTYARSVSGGSTSSTAYYNALWQKCSGFTLLQFQRATVDVASLWFTAWVNAQMPQLPSSQIVTSVLGSGVIIPSGAISILNGRDTTFSFFPATGYHFDSLVVDGAKVDSTSTYTFHGVDSAHTIMPCFSVNMYAIAAASGANGTIVPSGIVNVAYGASQSFVLTPATGYHPDSLLVDGSPVSVSPGYTFPAVSANHSIRATFAVNLYALTASAGPHGSIIPSGTVQIAYGDSQSYAIRPDPGYFVDSVLIDGVYSGSDTAYVFRDVGQTHTISARFTDGSVALQLSVAEGWNLISLPLVVQNAALKTLFPTAGSEAYAYSGGYLPCDTLAGLTGYWVRFSAVQAFSISGHAGRVDTIPVQSGWNLIGAGSVPVPVTSIFSPDSGFSVSAFFGYAAGYRQVDSLLPGSGYWVKASQPGRLILGAAGTSSAHRVAVLSPQELPPLPPAGPESRRLPASFAMFPAYPNPFNPTATVHCELPADSRLSVRVYNLLGQEVVAVAEGLRPAGAYDFRIDGSGLASGVYFVRLNAVTAEGAARSFTSTQKIILSK